MEGEEMAMGEPNPMALEVAAEETVRTSASERHFEERRQLSYGHC